jgi:integrase
VAGLLLDYDRLYALWALALTTGLRRVELLGLYWGDVDLDGGRLTVRRAILLVGCRPTWATPTPPSRWASTRTWRSP